jgi:hypothetical protein
LRGGDAAMGGRVGPLGLGCRVGYGIKATRRRTALLYLSPIKVWRKDWTRSKETGYQNTSRDSISDGSGLIVVYRAIRERHDSRITYISGQPSCVRSTSKDLEITYIVNSIAFFQSQITLQLFTYTHSAYPQSFMIFIIIISTYWLPQFPFQCANYNVQHKNILPLTYLTFYPLVPLHHAAFRPQPQVGLRKMK